MLRWQVQCFRSNAIFEVAVVECTSNSVAWTPKQTCLKEIGLRAQTLFVVPSSIVNIIGGPMGPYYGSLSMDFDNA